MKVLLDASAPFWVAQAVLNDVKDGLPFRRLPSVLSVVQAFWLSWRRRHALPAHVLAAAGLFERRLSLRQNMMIPASEIYDLFNSIHRVTEWSEEEVNRALADERAMEVECQPAVCPPSPRATAVERCPAACPPSPVSVSTPTERRFFVQSAVDAKYGGISPIDGAESPPHLRYKKWFLREIYVDPDVEVPEIPTSPGSEVDAISEDAVAPASTDSMSMSSRAQRFQDRRCFCFP